VKQELEAVKKELNSVKVESHKRKKLLIAQQQLMHAGVGSYNKVNGQWPSYYHT
jgi:zinc finger protein DZIP1